MSTLRLPVRLRSPYLHVRKLTTTANPHGRRSIPIARIALASVAHIAFWGTTGVLLTKHFLPISGPLIKTELPARNSPEEKAILETLEAHASQLPIVKALRADPEYHEHRPWSGIPEEDRLHRYMPGVLQGADKIAYNRVWVHNSGSTVGVLSMGRGICGFPNVVHGGVLATRYFGSKVVDEALGRTAMHILPTRNAVTARLSVNYRRPAIAHLFPSSSGFIILRTFVVEHTDRKGTVKATVEDQFGNLLLEAEGIFVVPRGWKLSAMQAGI